MRHSGVNCLKWHFAFRDPFNEFYLCTSADVRSEIYIYTVSKIIVHVNASSEKTKTKLCYPGIIIIFVPSLLCAIELLFYLFTIDKLELSGKFAKVNVTQCVVSRIL